MQRSVQYGPEDDPRVGARLRQPIAGFELRSDVRPWPPTPDGQPLDLAPYLVALDGGWRTYEPLKKRRLPEEVRRLARSLDESGATDRVITFANRYGFLGHPARMRDESGAWVGHGEALSFWRDELTVFRSIVGTWDRVVSRPESLKRELPANDAGVRVLDLGPRWVYLNPSEMKGRSLSEVVSERLRSIVMTQLAGSFNVSLEVGKPLQFRPNSLLAAIYLDLALELVGGTGSRLRECDYCHKPYLASRSDSRTCSSTCRSQARHVRNRTDGKEKKG